MTEAGLAPEGAGGKRRMPAFLATVFDDPNGRRVLFAAALAIAAAGLDPPILEPGMPSMQSAIRAEPELRSLLLVTSVWKAAMLLLGGALSDIFRSRRLLEAGLLGLAASSAGGDGGGGPGTAVLRGQVAGHHLAWASSCRSPSARWACPTRARRGPRRSASPMPRWVPRPRRRPALVQLNGPQGPYTPAFIACVVVALLAFVVARRRMPALPGALRGQWPSVVAIGLWAFGITAIIATIINLRVDPLELAIIAVGVGCHRLCDGHPPAPVRRRTASPSTCGRSRWCWASVS